MLEPSVKLFGKTIAFTPFAPKKDGAAEEKGTKIDVVRKDLSPSSQDAQESGGESTAKSEVTQVGSARASIPELSSSGSNGAEDEKNSSWPTGGQSSVEPPSSHASGSPVLEDSEGVDGEDMISGADGTTSQEVSGDDGGDKEQEVLRRPDKAVACPRCNSLETKFCYYNNYNVKQPRHFCKNCQRYWTAGGTLRNVPVGAGRRKNKHGNVLSPRQSTDMGVVRGDEPDIAAPMIVGKNVTMPVAVPVVQTVMGAPIAGGPKPVIRVAGVGNSDIPNTLPYTMRVPSLEATYILAPSEPLKPGDAALIGGNLPRLSTPGFEDSTPGSGEVIDGGQGWRGWRPKRESVSGSAGSSSVHHVKGEAQSSADLHKEGSTSVSWSASGGEIRNSQSAATAPYGLFNGAWPYGYNIGWSGAPAAFCAGGVTGNGNTLPTPPGGVAAWSGATPGNMWTGIPWGLPEVAWGPGWGTPWSIGPWAMGAAVAMSPAISTTTPTAVHTPVPCSSATSGTVLGKHPRAPEAHTGDGAVWAPKSLRIGDPDEATRNSAWRVLGVGSKPDISTSGTFKAFQPKGESKKVSAGDDQQTQQATLQANPATMSRSLHFQESN